MGILMLYFKVCISLINFYNDTLLNIHLSANMEISVVNIIPVLVT